MPEFVQPLWPVFWLMLGLSLLLVVVAVGCALFLVRRSARREYERSRAALESLAREIAAGNETAGRAFVEAVVQEARSVFTNFDYIKFALEEMSRSVGQVGAEVERVNGRMRKIQLVVENISLSMDRQAEAVAAENAESAAAESDDVRLLRQELAKAMPQLDRLASRSESLDQLLRSTARSLGKIKVSMI